MITIKDFTTVVRDSVTAVQARASTLVNLTIGSVLRSILEANAALAVWLQGLIVQVLATTRASTSYGEDLDSFVADYGLPARQAATPATGSVTFARFTTGQQAVVPVGANVQTQDQSQKFTVVVDTSNANYNATLGGYVLGPLVASISVPVQSTSAGTSGNVLANTITSVSTAIPFVDTVTNPAAFTNGEDQETDPQLRARFISYLGSLSKATLASVQYAINSVQQGLTSSVIENKLTNGATKLGYFFAVVDDGSGSPSAGLLAGVSAAVEAVRPLCSTFGVFGPTVSHANVVFVIATANGYVHGDLVAGAAVAITRYLNSLAVGQGLSYSYLISVIYGSSTGITNVTGVLLNSGTSDIAGDNQTVIRAGTVSGS